MTKIMQIYKCNICGNIVEMVHGGKGTLVCCGQPMQLMDAKTEDQGQEKHVPVVEKTAEGVVVTVGSVEHPMESEHHIEWIELVAGNKVYRTHLAPKQEPKAVFCTDEDEFEIRAYCNLHGLWKA